MKDIKNKVVHLNLLIDKRASMLGTAMKRNYTHFNETAIDSEKIDAFSSVLFSKIGDIAVSMAFIARLFPVLIPKPASKTLVLCEVIVVFIFYFSSKVKRCYDKIRQRDFFV